MLTRARKGFLLSDTVTLKCSFTSFLFVFNRPDCNTETRKKSTKALNINMTLANIDVPSGQMTQTSKLSHSIGGCITEHTQTLKISSFRSLHPLSFEKTHCHHFQALWLSFLLKETFWGCPVLT